MSGLHAIAHVSARLHVAAHENQPHNSMNSRPGRGCDKLRPFGASTAKGSFCKLVEWLRASSRNTGLAHAQHDPPVGHQAIYILHPLAKMESSAQAPGAPLDAVIHPRFQPPKCLAVSEGANMYSILPR
ncbi:hypothetical protein MN608_05636 [Microdochium nivale]|nr:hypothetical protein MN608_05636 [Microdochium nivale]